MGNKIILTKCKFYNSHQKNPSNPYLPVKKICIRIRSYSFARSKFDFQEHLENFTICTENILQPWKHLLFIYQNLQLDKFEIWMYYFL